MYKPLSIFMFLVLLGVQILPGQVPIFTDTGKTYTGTDSVTTDIYGPIDISSCTSISVSIDFQFSMPWEGSGNMESADECNFGNPCNGNPENQSPDCGPCWDFLYVKLVIDGDTIFTDLIGDAGTTNADQAGTISLPAYCLSGESNLQIEVYTQTWAGDESVTFSNIQVLCWGNRPTISATPNPVCEGQDIQFNESSGNYSSWSWSGPGGFNSPLQNPTLNNVTLADAGWYYLTVQDPNGCNITDSIEVQVIDFPTLPALGPYCELDAAITLPNPINGTSGTWSGTGVSGNTFDPGIAGGGVHTLTFTEATGNCSGSIQVSVNPEIILTPPGLPSSLCTSDDPINLPTTISGVTGTWTGTGVNGNTFDPGVAGQGNYTLTFTPDAAFCAEVLTVAIEVLESPVAVDPGTIDVCDDGTPVNLTQVNDIITGGNGNYTVNWYEDAGLTIQIGTPGAYVPPPTTVYATVSNGNCTSAPVSLTINLIPDVQIFPLGPIDTCGDANGEITLDLTGFNNELNGGSGDTVEWYRDPDLNNPINNPSSFSTSSTTIYAIVTNSVCATSPEPITINVFPRPVGNPTTLQACSSGGTVEYNLTLAEADVYPGGSNYTWYEDIDTTQLIPDPAHFNTVPPTTVYLVFSDGPCRSEPVAVTLEIVADVDLGNLADIELCYGEVIFLDGPTIGGMTYEWTGPNNFEASTEDVVVTGNADPSYEGIYTLIGTVGNCSDTATVNVIVHDEIFLSITEDGPILCHGDSTAAITAVYNGDSDPLDFSWSDPSFPNSASINNVPAGSYSVTVTDLAGCTASANVVVSEPPELTLSCQLISGVSGPGAEDAVVEITINGGTGPYDLIWTGDDSGSENNLNAGTHTIDNLPEGTINFTITDANGCTAECSSIIPAADCTIELEVVQIDTIKCAGDSTASIDVNISGATAPMSYDWNGTQYDGFDQLTNIPAGTYSLTITDADSCVASATIIISEPSKLIAVCSVVQDESAPGAQDGIAEVNIQGGTPAYVKLKWTGPLTDSIMSPVQGVNQITQLPSGTYTTEVTDGNACIAECEFIIEAQPLDCDMSLDISQLDSILCYGDSTASIDLRVRNATAPLSFQWSDPAIGNVEDPTELAAGTYSVTITDDKGCTADTSIVIIQPDPIELDFTILQKPTSASSSDGSINLTIDGGAAPYDLSYTGPTSGDTLNILFPIQIEELMAGTYTFTVKDNKGCSSEITVVLNIVGCDMSLGLLLEDSIQCYGDKTASIRSIVTDASGVVEFDWNIDVLDGNPSPSGLGAGKYTLTITDDNLCTAIDSITITQPPELIIQCNPLSSTEVEISVNGGTPEYSYTLNGPGISQTGGYSQAGIYTITNAFEEGTFTITLTDSHGCESQCSFVIQAPECTLDIDSTIKQISCYGAADGEISLSISGGENPLTIVWGNPAYNGKEELSGLSEGTYSVTVTDKNNCRDSIVIQLIEPDSTTVEIMGSTTLCEGDTISLSAIDTFATYIWNGQAGTDTYAVTEPGQVTLEVHNARGCIAYDTIFISQLDTALTIIRDTLCADDQLIVNGTVYDINNPTGTELIPGGSRDGCDSTIIVDLHFVGVIDIEIIEPNCSGVTQTQARILGNGNAVLPYDIYANGSFYQTVNSLPFILTFPADGTYNIRIVDAQGCAFQQNILVTSREQVQVDILSDSVVVKGDTAQLSAVLSGPYMDFQWYPPEIVACDTCLSTYAILDQNTIFTLSVTDSFGCVIELNQTILVTEGVGIYIPNAFTPNLDGINDRYKVYLGPRAQGLLEMEIFDRWGDKLYGEYYDIANPEVQGWDGRFKGKFLNPGVYVYRIRVELRENEIKTFTGTLTLIR